MANMSFKKLHITFSEICLIVVLCASTTTLAEKDFTAEAKKPLAEYTFKVITYNICGLPDLITYGRNLAPMDKRFKYIGRNLRRYDIIGLQEAFVKKKSIIENELGAYYQVHGTDTGVANPIGSGVMIFSRWPIYRSHYEKWRKSVGPDALSHKGFVLATTKIGKDLMIDVYNLHAQAGGSKEKIDIDNMYQLANAMKKLSVGDGNPILLIGDFNCRFGDEQCSVLLKETGVTNVMDGQKGVDHIFYRTNNSGWNIEVESHAVVFDKKFNGKRISDHEGFEVVFKFIRE